MSRYIDADALREEWLYENGTFEPNDVLDSIDCQPTVDAVQVVRCSECVHFVEWTAYEKTHFRFQYDGMCKYWNCISTNKNSFCNHGLRITDGYCADGERRSE